MTTVPPLSIDLFTAAQPHLLACTLVHALDRQGTVALNKLDYMNLTCVLEGVVYESASDAYMLVDEWLESGLANLTKGSSDRLTLDNPLSAVLLLQAAEREGLLCVVPESRGIDGIEYFLPPSPYVQQLRRQSLRKNPDRHDPKELLRGLFPVYDPTAASAESRLVQLERMAAVRRLSVPKPFTTLFPKTPEFFTRLAVADSFFRSLGASIRDGADLLTAHRPFYRWLRNELFVPLNFKRIRRISVFTEAISVAASATTVYDVRTLLEHQREWSSYRKLNERIESRQSGVATLAVYALEEIAGAFGIPLVWLVKLGSFIAKTLRTRK